MSVHVHSVMLGTHVQKRRNRRIPRSYFVKIAKSGCKLCPMLTKAHLLSYFKLFWMHRFCANMQHQPEQLQPKERRIWHLPQQPRKERITAQERVRRSPHLNKMHQSIIYRYISCEEDTFVFDMLAQQACHVSIRYC